MNKSQCSEIYNIPEFNEWARADKAEWLACKWHFIFNNIIVLNPCTALNPNTFHKWSAWKGGLKTCLKAASFISGKTLCFLNRVPEIFLPFCWKIKVIFLLLQNTQDLNWQKKIRCWIKLDGCTVSYCMQKGLFSHHAAILRVSWDELSRQRSISAKGWCFMV